MRSSPPALSYKALSRTAGYNLPCRLPSLHRFIDRLQGLWPATAPPGLYRDRGDYVKQADKKNPRPPNASYRLQTALHRVLDPRHAGLLLTFVAAGPLGSVTCPMPMGRCLYKHNTAYIHRHLHNLRLHGHLTKKLIQDVNIQVDEQNKLCATNPDCPKYLSMENALEASLAGPRPTVCQHSRCLLNPGRGTHLPPLAQASRIELKVTSVEVNPSSPSRAGRLGFQGSAVVEVRFGRPGLRVSSHCG